MEKVTGRTDDMIILRGVNLFPTQVEELILRTPALSPHFQCVLTREGRLDGMTVTVERRPDAARRGRGRRRRRAGPSGQGDDRGDASGSTSSAPGSIERSVGKMRRIVDHR